MKAATYRQGWDLNYDTEKCQRSVKEKRARKEKIGSSYSENCIKT